MSWDWVQKARAIIGRLLDVLLIGRQAGLWNKNPGAAPGLEEIKAKDRAPWR